MPASREEIACATLEQLTYKWAGGFRIMSLIDGTGYRVVPEPEHAHISAVGDTIMQAVELLMSTSWPEVRQYVDPFMSHYGTTTLFMRADGIGATLAPHVVAGSRIARPYAGIRGAASVVEAIKYLRGQVPT